MNRDDALIPFTVIDALTSITNVYELRLFGFVLAKSQAVIKKRQDELKELNMKWTGESMTATIPARYIDTNYTKAEQSLTLATRTINYIKDGTTYKLNIISNPAVIRTGGRLYIQFTIHRLLWYALLDFSRGWRYVNLRTVLKLDRSATILYMIVTNQTRPVTYRVDTLRSTLGATSGAYDRTNNLITRYLIPAREQLNRESEWTFEWKCERVGRGGRYQHITIIPKRTENRREEDAITDTIRKQRVRLDERVRDFLEWKFSMTTKEMERIEEMLLNVGNWTQQIDKLQTVHEYCHAAGVKNPKAYLTKSLQVTV